MMSCTALVGWMPSQNRNSSGRSHLNGGMFGRDARRRHICQTKCIRVCHDVVEQPERIEPHDSDSRKRRRELRHNAVETCVERLRQPRRQLRRARTDSVERSDRRCQSDVRAPARR